jgi:hypothetical protein
MVYCIVLPGAMTVLVKALVVMSLISAIACTISFWDWLQQQSGKMTLLESREAQPHDSDRWHVLRDGERLGQITTTELFRLAEAGFLRPSDHLCRPGSSEWRRADSFTHLFRQQKSPV